MSHEHGRNRDDNENQTDVFVFGRVLESCKGSALFWKVGRGAAAHLHLKIHAQKQHVFPSTQKWAFTTWYNK